MGEAHPKPDGQPPATPEKKRPVSAAPVPENVSHVVPTGPGMEFILDIPLEITVELGRTHMVINDLLKLGQGAVIELGKMAGETLEIRANQKLIAKGEVVEINEKYGVRLTEIVSHAERVEKLK